MYLGLIPAQQGPLPNSQEGHVSFSVLVRTADTDECGGVGIVATHLEAIRGKCCCKQIQRRCQTPPGLLHAFEFTTRRRLPSGTPFLLHPSPLPLPGSPSFQKITGAKEKIFERAVRRKLVSVQSLRHVPTEKKLLDIF